MGWLKNLMPLFFYRKTTSLLVGSVLRNVKESV